MRFAASIVNLAALYFISRMQQECCEMRAGTPVRASASGTVRYAGNELRGYGNLVLIEHSGGYVTAYAHNEVLTVKRGQTVKRGEVVARSGQTGNVKTPQLHFEIRKGTQSLDPRKHLVAMN